MPLSLEVRQELKTFFNALNDRILDPALAADRAVYVPEVNGGDKAKQDPVEEIAMSIDFHEGGSVQLFSGQRGTGKSTELKRLKAVLEDMGIVAFYVDMSEYILLTKPIEISDFLISMAGAMSDGIAADPRFADKASPGYRTYWERLKHFLETTVEFKELNLKLGDVADIKAELKNTPDFKQRIQSTARGYITQIVRDAHEFFADAVGHVRASLGQPDAKVVLIVDSVERIRGVGAEDMQVFDSVRNLFFAHAEHLRIPQLNTVYTVPPYLSVLAAGTGALMGGAAVRSLVSTHIFMDRSRATDPAGLDIMRGVIEARYGDWRKVFSEATLNRLALSSGGDLREYFRLIRLCLTAVRDDGDLPLTQDAVKQAENAVRNELLPIPEDNLAWLARIAASHETCLGTEAELPVLARFLDTRLVLNYRNGSDWYDVHPLIRDMVDEHGQPAPIPAP